MKITQTYVILFLTLSSPLFAQDSEPEQVTDKTQSSEPNQTPDSLKAPERGKTLKSVMTSPMPSASPSSLSQKDKALLQSAYEGNLEEVQALIAKGADASSADEEMRTPLIMAAYNGHTAIVEFLFENGADINAIDKEGKNALNYVSKRSFNETALYLINHGVEVNVQSRKKGVTALMIAAAAGNQDLVQMLLEHGADPNLKDVYGRTARDLAQKKGNSAVVELLPDSPATSSE